MKTHYDQAAEVLVAFFEDKGIKQAELEPLVSLLKKYSLLMKSSKKDSQIEISRSDLKKIYKSQLGKDL